MHVPLQLAALRKVVDEAARRVREGVEPAAALDVVESIEAAERGRVYAGLLELIRPEIARVLRVVDSHAERGRKGEKKEEEPLLARLREAATGGHA